MNTPVDGSASSAHEQVRDAVRYQPPGPLRPHGMLLPLLRRAHAPRVVTVSSAGIAWEDRFDDPNWEGRRYSAGWPMRRAGTSCHSELQPSGAVARNCSRRCAPVRRHDSPPPATRTYLRGGRSHDRSSPADQWLLPTVRAPCRTWARRLLGPMGSWSSEAFRRSRPRPRRRDTDAAGRLWEASEKLTGILHL